MKNLKHTPGGSPRNADGGGKSNYACPDPLPKFTTAQNSSDVNNGKTASKPSGNGGGYIHTPSK
jgi:hypothetical protein